MRWRIVLAFAGLLLMVSSSVRAESIPIGVLSFDVFIPSSNGSPPGVNAFNITNLTGAFSLAPNFPVTTDLTFTNASLALSVGCLPQCVPPTQLISLGNIGQGPLLDSMGNPLTSLQFTSTAGFSAADFTATLDPTTFVLADGSTFKASGSISVELVPSSGSTLVAGVDTVVIMAQPSSTVVPEPSTWMLMLTGLLCVLGFQRSESRKRQMGNRYERTWRSSAPSRC